MRRLFLLLIVSLFCLAPGAAQAQNAPLTLNVEDLELAEIVARLSEASGVALTLDAQQLAARRGTFRWENTTLGGALRDLAEEFGVLPRRSETSGYALQAGTLNRHPLEPERAPHATTPEGYRVFLYGLRLGEASLFYPAAQQQERWSRRLSLTFICRAPAGEDVAGVEFRGAAARDDLGIPAISYAPLNPIPPETLFPDEHALQFDLGLPDVRAATIEEITGEIWGHRYRREAQLELPAPTPEKPSVSQEILGLKVTVSAWRRLEPDPRARPWGRDVGVGAWAAQVAAEWPASRTPPLAPGARDRYAGFPPPVAFGASGKRYPGIWVAGGGLSRSGSSTVVVRRGEVAFLDVPEPLVRLRWEVRLPDEIERLARVRLTEIPLPLPPGSQPLPEQPPVPDARAARSLATGWLSCAVLVNGEPVHRGVLILTLSPKQGEDWGPPERHAVRVSPSGEARLMNLRPGVYRLEREYLPAPTGGSSLTIWNRTVEVTILRGQEAPVAPLALDRRH